MYTRNGMVSICCARTIAPYSTFVCEVQSHSMRVVKTRYQAGKMEVTLRYGSLGPVEDTSHGRSER